MRELIPILALFALAAATVFLVFLLGRSVVDARAARRRPEDEDAGVLAPPEPPPPRSFTEKVDRNFDMVVSETGLGISTPQALGIMALCGTVLGGLPLIFRNDYLLAAIGLFAGLMLPLMYFLVQRVRYRWRVQDQLPDAFFLLARSLRSGQNLEGAMGTVAKYGTQPLAGEFKRVVDRMELGLSAPAALQGMSRRLNLSDFNMLVTAVSLHRTTGGNLAALLDRVATAARDRSQFRGYFRAATALSRITGFAIAIAPVLLLVGYAVWQPDFIDRFTNSVTGIRMLTVAAILEIVGILWMAALLRSDY